MKNARLLIPFCLIFFSGFVITSCGGKDPSDLSDASGKSKKDAAESGKKNDLQFGRKPAPNSSQISEYVRRIFQDGKGNLCFGSNGDGVCRFDGESLTYFSTQEGLGGTQITGILEDKSGKLWFSTNGGVSVFDGKSIVNYTVNDGLNDNWVWSILEDHEGMIWAGTLKGVSRCNPLAWPWPDGKVFTSFPIPTADVKNPVSSFNTSLVWCILEDKKGNMWFGTDGAGICKFDGKTFSHLTMKDGLCDNSVVCMVEDKSGIYWFSSMFGGLSRYDGKSFANFTEKDAIGSNEVWNIYEDKSGNIWFSSEGFGVYRYSLRPNDAHLADISGQGWTLANFGEKNGLHVAAVQSIFEDKEGRLWMGGGGGLYRLEGESFINVKQNGPWK